MTCGSECSGLPLVEQREWADVTAPNASRVYLVDECLNLTTTWLRSRRVRMYKFFAVDAKTKRARNAEPKGAVRAAEEEESGPCATHTPKLLVVVAIVAHRGSVSTTLFLDVAVAVSA